MSLVIRSSVFVLVSFVLAACAGAAGESHTPASVTSASESTSLDGKSFDVTLEFPGDASQKDTLRFSNAKFESTLCTGFGFPQWTGYSAKDEGESTQFRVTTRHPEGTTMDWTGHVRGDSVEGTARRTMNGAIATGTFKGKRLN